MKIIRNLINQKYKMSKLIQVKNKYLNKIYTVINNNDDTIMQNQDI